MSRRLATLLRGLAALAALVMLVVGVPAGLVLEVGWPLPMQLPTWNQLAYAITSGQIDDTTIIKTLAVLLWLAWANFTLGLAVELVALMRSRPARRLAGLQPAQHLAANLLAAASLAVVTLSRPTTSTFAPPSHLRLPVATTLAEEQPPALTDLRDATEAALSTSTPPRLIRLPDGQEEVRGDEGARVYHVQRGDTLWDLAERFLGAGVRWREIRDLNIGRPQPDGETLQPGEDVYPGWTLILPDTAHAVAQTAATQTAQPSDAPTVVVERGDTLWDLADEHLGDPFGWPYIYQRNRGKPQPDGRQLTDPDLIHPSWLLHLPEVEIHSDQSQPAPPAQTKAPGGPATAEPPSPDPHPIHVLEPLTPTPNPDAVPAVPSPGPLRADSSPPADPIADTARGGENALAPSPGVDETEVSLEELTAITSAAALVGGLVDRKSVV